MSDKALCFVTTSLEGKGAYAIRADNDESVYIPVAIAEATALEEFDEVIVLMIRNDRSDPPWRAIKIKRVTDEDR